MQFIRLGPDVPERLLQLHEEGDVVFFCGAGISYPATLPDFKGLTTRLYDALAVTTNAVQKSAIRSGQFDTAIGLLENDHIGGREAIRRAIASILKPNLASSEATATHEALLKLGKTRKGQTRIVTTNFDRLFEEVKKLKSLAFPAYQAPLLPIPKRSWDGLVYLHGLLSDAPTAYDLNQLVVSSGDFGLAYLKERWAARFVSELFRCYTVCFVGYSINDPILRYMMDALAADRLLGESSPEMFAFGSYSNRKKDVREIEWAAKNVTPILYRENSGHTYLHKTLQAWADTYRDGVRGKERIVVECAIARPLSSTKQDDFIGRMAWALSDLSGLPAKQFAELDPVPSIDWLEPLNQKLYRHSDLGRFGVPPLPIEDPKLAFSLTNRPTPYSIAPMMALVDDGRNPSQWDKVMVQLASWLARHLDDPKLLIWVIKQGSQLHVQFVNLIEQRLDDLANLSNSNVPELDRIRANAPNAIPRPAMQILWRLVINGRTKSRKKYLSLYLWHKQFKYEGLTGNTRWSLREHLKPCLSLREPFNWSGAAKTSIHRIRDIVEAEVVLSSDSVHSGLSELRDDENWAAQLPSLLRDFSALLLVALDLMRELGDADNEHDPSYIHQPSIEDHSQNKRFHDWTALIELCRDAWLATAITSPERARITAEAWIREPYPTFRRLALFAAIKSNVIPIEEALSWLLAENGRWLWVDQVRRETLRLLVRLAPDLGGALLAKLEQAILAGPPPDLYRDDIDADELILIRDHAIWLRLAKAIQAGAAFSEEATTRFATLSEQHPAWQLAPDESDEFIVWMGEGFLVGQSDSIARFTEIPRRRMGILKYLLAHPTLAEKQQDDWRKQCSERFQGTSYALCQLTKSGQWPTSRWRDAFQAWTEDKLRCPSWRFMAPVVADAPEDFVRTMSYGIGRWLQGASKCADSHDVNFLKIARRVLQLDFEIDGNIDDPVSSAINHPIGYVTQALLDWWFEQKPNDGQGLPNSLKQIFSTICDTTLEKYRHGRVLLAAHALSLFRVDKDWAVDILLPLLNWHKSDVEARSAWEGFLWSPRLYRPLMDAIKPDFLETARRYAQLGKHKEQFAAFLTFAALDRGDTFTTTELAGAIKALPPDGMRESAQALAHAIEGAGDQREEYWQNRILPFWTKIWPKSKDHVTNVRAESVARICIAAGNDFPNAITIFGKWLREVQHPDFVIRQLLDAGMPGRFSEPSLAFLFAVVGSQRVYAPRDFQKCLKEIAATRPDLEQDYRFIKLDGLARGG